MKRKSSHAAPEYMTKYLSIMSIAHVQSMTFDDLVVHVRQPDTLKTTGACLAEVAGACNTKIFLAAYMIAFHPKNVFETMGRLEQDLFDLTGPLVSAFEAIVKKAHSKEHTDEFKAMLQEYLTCFDKWRVPDIEKLVNRIKHALVALYEAENHLPADEADDSRLKVIFM